MNEKRMNLIFLGSFAYPQGMAGTKRIQHAIDGIRDDPDVSIRVIVLRQSSDANTLNGHHKGIPYETVMGDLLRFRMAFLFPLFYLKARHALKRAFRSDYDNIIYKYGPPNLFNVGILAYAQRLGYKIVFDIVEDYSTAKNLSRSVSHRIKMIGINYLIRRVKHLVSGIVVISSHLQKKYDDLSEGEVPLHYRSISVDFDRYPSNSVCFSDPLTLFYSGTFGRKDGVPVLLEAFDVLAAKHKTIRLVLTGKGSDEALKPVFARIEASPYKDRINYKGYLDDDAYYAALNAADIPCMTRINIDYARAGFPFKLGEFLATGKPVIASRISDVEALLEDRRDAALVEPGDSGGIAKAVEYLMDHPADAAAIGRCGRAKARALFDYPTQGQLLLKFLRDL